MPSDHPARDVWDTFLVENRQCRNRPAHAHIADASAGDGADLPRQCAWSFLDAPIAMKRRMRHTSGCSISSGLAVDEHITLADLKGVLQELARQLFGPKRKIRFRCDFFPFVEPGVDFAVDCAICDGAGCRVCKHSGWLEMGGAGMVHRKVLSGWL
ncbi:MAG: hypothetical protein R2848_07965 [Thermomicrobiales bacterium]